MVEGMAWAERGRIGYPLKYSTMMAKRVGFLLSLSVRAAASEKSERKHAVK